MRVRVCVCVCVCVCARARSHPSVPSHTSETREAIAIKVNTVTTSVTGMHHVLTTLVLTFIQGDTDLNHKNNKCSNIS